MKKIHDGWIEDVLFFDDKFVKKDDIDVYFFIAEYNNPRGSIITEHYTHMIDLSSLEGMSNYKGNRRRLINKKYDNFDYQIESDFSKERSQMFLDNINAFHAWAKMPEYDKKYFNALIDKGFFIISSINKETNSLAGFSSFLKIGDKARLINLISIEGEDMDARTMTLHHAIQNLGNHGIKYIDFGGAGPAENPSPKMLKIRMYKGGFGGELVKYYKGREAGTKKGVSIIKEKYSA